MITQDGSSRTLSALESLPVELLLRILSFGSPLDVIRLSAVSRACREIARSEVVWRTITLAVLGSDTASVPGASEDDPEGWWRRARFLLPHAQHLGYFLSSTPYTSRIIRLSATFAPPSSPELPIGSPAPAPSNEPVLTITAHQLVPTNAHDSQGHPPPPIPHGCIIDPSTRTAYICPRRGPGSANPDAGLSVDFLEPHYEALPLFHITETSGALLTTTPYSGLSPNYFSSTLKLRLASTEREVKGAREDQSVEERRSSEASALYSLFTGRSPVYPWPTKDLVQSAFRGLVDWISGRGVEGPVLSSSKDCTTASRSSLGFIHGFSLQIRRQISPPSLPGSYPVSPDLQAEADEAPRRYRGVGPNGGPAVLWRGREGDPDAAETGDALLRTGQEAGGLGGFVFRLPRIPTQRLPGPGETIVGEEVIRTDREEFYPIKAPAQPFTFDDTSSTNSESEINAASLEGLWLGTYSSHGLEYGWLSVKLSEEVLNEDGSRTYEREIDFIKATGDSNVPSGQTSWSAILPSITLPSSASLDDPSSLGTIPSVANETLLRWSAIDPNDGSVPPSEMPRWETGSRPGAGRVALPGYVDPGWTSAIVTSIRSTTRLERITQKDDGSGEEVRDEKDVETVEEIRVRWQELGKVSVFRRVRV